MKFRSETLQEDKNNKKGVYWLELGWTDHGTGKNIIMWSIALIKRIQPSVSIYIILLNQQRHHHYLLAQLLQWHRWERDDWWEHDRMCSSTPEVSNVSRKRFWLTCFSAWWPCVCIVWCTQRCLTHHLQGRITSQLHVHAVIFI